MKNKPLVTLEEMAELVGSDIQSINRLIERQIIFPAQREPLLLLFAKDSERIVKIGEMLRLGFSENDVKRIAKEVGLPTDQKNSNEKVFTIGEFCGKFNLSPRQIKYWENLGLFFPSVRSKGGIRLYNESLIIHIRFIQNLQSIGFELLEIKDIIENSRSDIVESRLHRMSEIIRDLRPILKNIKKINK
ncbi:MAG: MerR family transcriptional regulator [bacterium]|nr:MerR family transcriptional regulator [bacterium]